MEQTENLGEGGTCPQSPLSSYAYDYIMLNILNTFCCGTYSSLLFRCSKSVGKWRHSLVWTLSYFSPPSTSLEVCWWVLLPWWLQRLVPGRSQVVPSLILVRLSCTRALASFPGSSPASLGTGNEPGNEPTLLKVYKYEAFFLYKQRRRSTQDELMMREYFQEGDLISVSDFNSHYLV